MSRQSPIRRLHQVAEASLRTYGPSESPAGIVQVVESFGELELEYGALRKHCILLDLPHRALIEVTGKDRVEFLNRMITQELKGMSPFRVRRSFWLNKKGRIDADMRIIDLPSRTLLEVDVHAAERTLKGLANFIISEDVQLDDWSERTHRIALHGPSSVDLVMALAQNAAGADASGPAFDELLPDRACVVRLFGTEVVIYREDQCGEIGLEMIVSAKHVLNVYQHLLEAGHDRAHDDEESIALARSSTQVSASRVELSKRIRLRPAGWHAYNIARIEAGTPLYNLDFGPDSLPAETAVFSDRVSLNKGCYLGQEVVARMHSRGHPKQCLVAIKFESKPNDATGLPRQPVEGTPLFAPGNPESIGQVTSSTLSPMLGSAPVAFAQVRYAHVQPGTVLSATIEGDEIKGVIQSHLAFFRRNETAPSPDL